MNRFIFLLLIFLAACSINKNAVAPEDTAGNTNPVHLEIPIHMVSQDKFSRMQSDPYEVLETVQLNNFIKVVVRYGGGCRDHEFSLIHTGAFKESMPVQLDTRLIHNANGDACRALVMDTIYINTKTLQYANNEVLVLSINDSENQMRVTY